VLGEIEVLLGHEHTLAEDVLVDLLAVGLWDEPARTYQSRSRFVCGEGSAHVGEISRCSVNVDLEKKGGKDCCREFLALFGESRTTGKKMRVGGVGSGEVEERSSWWQSLEKARLWWLWDTTLGGLGGHLRTLRISIDRLRFEHRQHQHPPSRQLHLDGIPLIAR
jgi:hypothetical protein